MATHAAGAKLELQLHPGDEYVGSWEPESLQVLVGIYWSVVWQIIHCTDLVSSLLVPH